MIPTSEVLNEEKEQSAALPEGHLLDASESLDVINLDPVTDQSGEMEDAVAIEGDWHDIPSLKSMLYEDAKDIKTKLKDLENGSYVTLKDALKKAMPHQYAYLKELKDILFDRNSIKNI